MIDSHHGWNVSFKPLVLGYVLSLSLALAAYRIVSHYHLKVNVLMPTIIAIGTVSALLQMIFYFHIGLESKPRWNLMMFLFMVFVTIVLVGGSLWIMTNINYNLMPDMK